MWCALCCVVLCHEAVPQSGLLYLQPLFCCSVTLTFDAKNNWCVILNISHLLQNYFFCVLCVCVWETERERVSEHLVCQLVCFSIPKFSDECVSIEHWWDGTWWAATDVLAVKLTYMQHYAPLLSSTMYCAPNAVTLSVQYTLFWTSAAVPINCKHLLYWSSSVLNSLLVAILHPVQPLPPF